ncbi:hypothetical protein FVB9288_00524 [Flavobacterium sp. CECT 9288]|uniref:glycosyltransferase family 2 protein n=1 Tax=Flavobacterium sp. CECT 9288 TaxID=2845819 RepID=UPI001E4D00B9|nr:glycosyltransferase family 2 protein [Flavobacterium sp. CECT 9288]CAH0334909.1 hypothetical protein FVB9288_00524 [Flavobacterium sp. CECT 9288]
MDHTPPMISFLITHYNRPNDLLLCLNAIRGLDLCDYEIVVSDDASEAQHLEIIQQYPIDQLLLADKNGGLAANINRGLQACRGQYIIYCQEDFMLSSKLAIILPECLEHLASKKLDLIRFVSNMNFNSTSCVSTNISRIPKFAFRNFLQNYYQYSDHPFITTKDFHPTFGFYQEETSGRYGETEYAIRILKSAAKIGITKQAYASTIDGSQSVLANESKVVAKSFSFNKKAIHWARAFRLYAELLLYDKKNRGLKTYRNFRN